VIGRNLKQADRLLMEAGTVLSKRLGKTAAPARKITALSQQLRNLRVDLDNLISFHCPDRSNQELNRAYYGPYEEGPCQ
jgi:hypothetical protein